MSIPLALFIAFQEPYCFMEIRGRVINLESMCQIERTATSKNSPAQTAKKNVLSFLNLEIRSKEYFGGTLSGSITNLSDKAIEVSFIKISVSGRTYLVAVNRRLTPGLTANLGVDVQTSEKLSSRIDNTTVLEWQDGDTGRWYNDNFTVGTTYLGY